MCMLVVQCLSLLFSFFDLGCMLVNWGRLLILGLFIECGTAKHCIDRCMVLFRYGATLLCRAGYMLGFATHF